MQIKFQEVNLPKPQQITMYDLGTADYEEILGLWERGGLPVRPEGRDARDTFARQMADHRQRIVGLRAGTTLIAVVVLTHDGRKGWLTGWPSIRLTGAAGWPAA